MLKYLLLILSFSTIISCNKNLEVDNPLGTNTSTRFYLDFDINNIDYQFPEQQETLKVETHQDLELEISFTDIKYMSEKFPYIHNIEMDEDSVALCGIIRYITDENNIFEEQIVDLEIVLIESKSNLIALTDSTYVYSSNFVLYQNLKNHNFGNKNLFSSSDISHILFTLPEMTDPLNWGPMIVSSNGFYFENEQLEFSDISYDLENDEIEIKGNFEVELKFLSCGFYSLFRINNAKFSSKIK